MADCKSSDFLDEQRWLVRFKGGTPEKMEGENRGHFRNTGDENGGGNLLKNLMKFFPPGKRIKKEG